MGRVKRPAPLPVRDGLNPVRMQLPHPGAVLPRGARVRTEAEASELGSEEPVRERVYAPSFGTLEEYVRWRFAPDPSEMLGKLDRGEIVDELGRPWPFGSPYRAGALIFFYRDPAPEKPVPFEVDILFEDDDLLVVDKPHFLASTPKGAYVVESVLVRMRRQLGLPELSPAHRLDRITAGVLVMTKRQELRRPYHDLFAQRTIDKTYEAVAPVRADLELPTTVRSRIKKEPGIMWAQTIEGEPNTESLVELLDTKSCDPQTHAGHAAVGLYRLTPHTGKTHQLRIHMASLGLGILNDNYYPTFYSVESDDYSNPLQLLSRSIEFNDPVTGERRRFESRRVLDLWQN
ncbi:pseudouridine synthase [Populibacterium corticicola]|uniref:RNA pseudouridylate synthase n=1 Tax=Populibacterium corticicola TaxID=1812826 RepID=A0ABW5XGG2_9MICO